MRASRARRPPHWHTQDGHRAPAAAIWADPSEPESRGRSRAAHRLRAGAQIQAEAGVEHRGCEPSTRERRGTQPRKRHRLASGVTGWLFVDSLKGGMTVKASGLGLKSPSMAKSAGRRRARRLGKACAPLGEALSRRRGRHAASWPGCGARQPRACDAAAIRRVLSAFRPGVPRTTTTSRHSATSCTATRAPGGGRGPRRQAALDAPPLGRRRRVPAASRPSSSPSTARTRIRASRGSPRTRQAATQPAPVL